MHLPFKPWWGWVDWLAQKWGKSRLRPTQSSKFQHPAPTNLPHALWGRRGTRGGASQSTQVVGEAPPLLHKHRAIALRPPPPPKGLEMPLHAHEHLRTRPHRPQIFQSSGLFGPKTNCFPLSCVLPVWVSPPSPPAHSQACVLPLPARPLPAQRAMHVPLWDAVARAGQPAFGESAEGAE